MKKLVLIFFLSAAFNGFSQTDCKREVSFDSLQAFLKENYAGYNDKVNASNLKEFKNFTARHAQMIKKARNNAQYYRVLSSWINFFKDRHLSVTVPFDTANGKLAAAIANVEVFPVDKISITALEKTGASSVEGIYYTADSSYSVAVIKSDNGFRKYAGIILSSKAPQWKPGYVKFELVQGEGKTFDVLWYNRFHQPIFTRLDFEKENTFYTEGWYKNGNRKTSATGNVYKPLFDEERSFNAFFKQIDEETSYLRIGSFDSDFIGQIDSVVNANRALLEKLPYLVIDVRGNGGGADISYRPLKKFMYTDPVKSIGVDLLATPYNIDITKQLIGSISGIPEAEKKEYFDMLERARQSNKRMFNFYPDTTETAQSIPLPRKIAVVIDGRCASTTEQFILEARQSKKVTLFGTHSMGVLGYANVRDKSFCPGFEVHYPSTRSRRIDVGQGIDNKGISPDVELDLQKEGWLKEVTEAIKK